MKFWRNIKSIVILALLLAFSLYAHNERTKSKNLEMSQRIKILREDCEVYAYAMSILPAEQRKIIAEATVKQGLMKEGFFGGLIEPNKIHSLLNVKVDDNTAGTKKGGAE